MSRKRKKASEIEAVPEVIEDALAEGSGPVQAVAHVGMEDDPEPEVPKASVRTKSRSRKASHATADVIELSRQESRIPGAEDIIADADADAEAESVADLVAAAEAVAEGGDDSEANESDVKRGRKTEAKRGGRKAKAATKGRDATVDDDDATDGDAMVASDVTDGDVTNGDAMVASDATDGDAMVASDTTDGDAMVASDATDARAPSGRRRRAQKRARKAGEAVEVDATDGDVIDGEPVEVAAMDGDNDAMIASDATPNDATDDGEPMLARDAATGDGGGGDPTRDATRDGDDGFDGDPMLRDAIDGGASDGEPNAGIEVVEGELAAEGATGDDATATLPTSAAALDAGQLKQLVEALVFASDKPITVVRLRQLTRVADVKRLEDALAELATDYADRGLVLQQVSGGFQFRTRTQWSAWVQQLIAGRPVRLTRAQLETLAIIAYRQPITRPEIDDIRGVDSSATLKLLIDRMLIRILGKKEEVGRPMLYGTTKEFLDFFSLGDLRELPTLREYSELTDESRQVITDRLGDLPEGGEGDGGAPPVDGGGMAPGAGPGAGGDPGLGAAAEPTAADLIARYVAELDASPLDVTSPENPENPGSADIAFDLLEGEHSDGLEAMELGEGSLADLDPFVLAASGASAHATERAPDADDSADGVSGRASTDSEVVAEDFAPDSTDAEAVAAEAVADFEGDSTNPGIDLEALEPAQLDGESAELAQLDVSEAAAEPAQLDGESAELDVSEAAAEPAQLDGESAELAQLDAAAPVSEPVDADDFASGSGGFVASADAATDVDLAQGSGGIAASDAPVDPSDKASVIAAALAAMAAAPPASTTAEMAAQAGDLVVIDGSTDAIVEPVD